MVRIIEPFKTELVVTCGPDTAHGAVSLGNVPPASALDTIRSMISPAFTSLVNVIADDDKPEILKILESPDKMIAKPDGFEQFDSEGAAILVREKPEIVMHLAGLVSGAIVTELTRNSLESETVGSRKGHYPKFSAWDPSLVEDSRRYSYSADTLLRSYLTSFLAAPFKEIDSLELPDKIEIIRFSGGLAADTALGWMSRRRRCAVVERKTSQLLAEIKLCGALNRFGMLADYGSYSQRQSGINITGHDGDRPVVFEVVTPNVQQSDLILDPQEDGIYRVSVAGGGFLNQRNFSGRSMQALKQAFPSLNVAEEVQEDAGTTRSRNSRNRTPKTYRRSLVPRPAF